MGCARQKKENYGLYFFIPCGFLGSFGFCYMTVVKLKVI